MAKMLSKMKMPEKKRPEEEMDLESLMQPESEPEMEPSEEHPSEPSALESFSDEELLAEMEKRGLSPESQPKPEQEEESDEYPV